MSEERLQRILSRAGIASRRKAEELIREGRVTVNGQVAEIGSKADPARDAVKVDGKRVQPHSGPGRYLLLNKPRGVMSTVSDPQGRTTVLDLIPPALRKALVPVGRLDYETEGLILLTDDGDFAEHVAHPRYGGIKTYEVKVKGEPPQAALDRLREGIVIEGKRTAPAKIRPRPARTARRRQRGEEDEGHNTWWVVDLTEGRTRQIREMFQRIGHPVQKLRRVAIGPLKDPHMPLGTFRELTEREVETLRRITAKPKPKKVQQKKEEPHPRPLSHLPSTPRRERGGASRAARAGSPSPPQLRPPSPGAREGGRRERGTGGEAPRPAPAKRAATRRPPARKTSGKKPPSGPRRGRG